MVTYNGKEVVGAEMLAQHLMSLTFKTVNFGTPNIVSHPDTYTKGILINVTGSMSVDGSQVPILFGHFFRLVPSGSAYQVVNEIFQLYQ